MSCSGSGAWVQVAVPERAGEGCSGLAAWWQAAVPVVLMVEATRKVTGSVMPIAEGRGGVPCSHSVSRDVVGKGKGYTRGNLVVLPSPPSSIGE